MRKLIAVTIFLLLLGSLALADTFDVTASAPGVQTPSNGTYETFNSVLPGTPFSGFVTNYGGTNYIGTYSGSLRWYGASQYGGAGGTGTYPALIYPSSESSSYTINLTASNGAPPANYFGLWFSALDKGNLLEFYRQGTLVFSFTPVNFIKLVGGCPDAEDPYCGNPNSAYLGRDGGEQFAYLNFFDTNGWFDTIVVTEESCNGCGFESDNQTVGQLETDPVGLPIPGVPEPSSVVLLGAGVAVGSRTLRRRP